VVEFPVLARNLILVIQPILFIVCADLGVNIICKFNLVVAGLGSWTEICSSRWTCMEVGCSDVSCSSDFGRC
jgi:hypothetical protein